jgi:uroporphyrinogen decarboxylase
MRARDNYLATLELRGTEWVPVFVDLHEPAWLQHAERLEAVVLRHPRVFRDYRAGTFPLAPADRFCEVYDELRDDWGCVWRNLKPGIIGQVVGHPLADWSAFRDYHAPDPRTQFDWPGIGEQVKADRAAGRLAAGYMSVTQAGFFDRLQFLRGMENLLMDFATSPPELDRLVEMVLDHNLAYVREYLRIGIEVMYFHGDIGGQGGLLFSPEAFRRHLAPAFRELFGACRAAGTHVSYSSDGHMLDVVKDLIACGASLHDPEVSTNTVPGIRRAYAGRLCASVQLDAQRLPAWSPEDVRRHVAETVGGLSELRGGLMVYAYVGADVPLANVDALCSALEEACGLPPV